MEAAIEFGAKQNSPDITARTKNAGLGLAGVDDTMTLNGGLVHVDSSQRRGTRSGVLLPLIACSDTSSEHTQQQSPDSTQEVMPVTEEA
jgi:signal transduction histidine kinase